MPSPPAAAIAGCEAKAILREKWGKYELPLWQGPIFYIQRKMIEISWSLNLPGSVNLTFISVFLIQNSLNLCMCREFVFFKVSSYAEDENGT